jgi:hypothetical protein
MPKVKVTITLKLIKYLIINLLSAVTFNKMNSHVQDMTPIDVRSIRSKVKVTMIYILTIVVSRA